MPARKLFSADSRWWNFILILMIVAPILVAIEYVYLANRIDTTAKVAFVESCEGNNDVRTQFVNFVGDILANSERATRATLASPTATAQQKVTAAKNLAGLRDFSKQMREKLALKDCSYPPTPTTILPQPG